MPRIPGQKTSLRIIAWVQGRLERHADTALGRLALAWFRACTRAWNLEVGSLADQIRFTIWIAFGGAVAVSPLFLGAWMNVDAAFFGPFGVMIALLTWALVLSGICVACAVLSPVYAEWRRAERGGAKAEAATGPRSASGLSSGR